ncbi:MAG: bifunctional aldolase/short-chain dehydrogenase [Pseudomonadota bacterium]|nr:bifunctional aldolase/short-chain dehydrogenase [Pseudomonadota bacterium]
MQSLWRDSEAAQFASDLELRVYTSRLLGRDKSLVLHGGGNTSVKIHERNLFGEAEQILYVKGSGWDLETIAAAGFTPLRLAPVQRLATLKTLPDTQMVNALAACKTLASAPAPSVEAILHAILPYRFVDHTHADAVVTITNTANGEARIREVYGNAAVIIPYVMPGFELARVCAQIFATEAGPQTMGMVLMNHGIFSFGEDARQSYERMIALVDCAERYLAKHNAWDIARQPHSATECPVRDQTAALRGQLSAIAQAPLIVASHRDEGCMAFIRRPDLASIAQQGPATPDHVIRTKRLPMLGRDVDPYRQAYEDYFRQHANDKNMLDAAPRIILDPELGLCAAGRSAKDAAIAAEIYIHTMDIIERAEALGGYRPLPAAAMFAVEYWDLEQAKLKKAGKPPLFAGEIGLVTGAASGIGAACVHALLAHGAAVIGLDIDDRIETLHRRADFLGIRCDVTLAAAIIDALEAGVRAFGGLDMLILNAGIFPASARIADLGAEQLQQTMHVNLDANLAMLRACHPFLKLAPKYGRVIVMGSKNVHAPGPGAAAYSASKAALNQLARVAALEWAGDGIRVNIIHPNAVFDTGIWTDEVLAERAAQYGITVAEYRTSNLLKIEIASSDVGELAAAMCSELFAKTTGAQVPIDGGNERTI